jgi:hypothetical protein
VTRFLVGFAVVGVVAFGVGTVVPTKRRPGQQSELARAQSGQPSRLAAPASEPLSTVSAFLIAAFPVLGRPQRVGDLPPAGSVDPAMAAQQGATLRFSRQAGRTRFGETLWLLPAHLGVCVVSSDHLVNVCGRTLPASETIAGVETIICAPGLPSSDAEIAGVVNSGRHAVLTLETGVRVPLPTENGAFAVRLPRRGPRAVSVQWRDRAGVATIGAGEPPGTAQAHCSSGR